MTHTIYLIFFTCFNIYQGPKIQLKRGNNKLKDSQERPTKISDEPKQSETKASKDIGTKTDENINLDDLMAACTTIGSVNCLLSLSHGLKKLSL